jgi:hypothetical protein
MIPGRGMFLCLPPAFAAVPQYFIHTTVALLSLSEPDKQFSHIRLPDKPFSTIPPFDTEWASSLQNGPNQGAGHPLSRIS